MVVVKGYGSTRNVTRSMMDAQAFFAVKRMAYGGYKVLVDA